MQIDYFEKKITHIIDITLWKMINLFKSENFSF